MTDEQVDRIVEHLCQHLNLAMRLKGTEAHPPEAKDIGFDPASVRTVFADRLAIGRRDSPPRTRRGERRTAVVLNEERGTDQSPAPCP
jgi:hypothetical protein